MMPHSSTPLSSGQFGPASLSPFDTPPKVQISFIDALRYGDINEIVKQVYSFNAIKEFTSRSSVFDYAVTGFALGYFSDRDPTQMALAGGLVGTAKEVLAIAYKHFTPADVKEAIEESSNVGLKTLSTFAIYNFTPEPVMNLAKFFIPDSITNFSEYSAKWAQEPGSIFGTLNPFVQAGTGALKLFCRFMSVTDIPKLGISTLTAHYSVEALYTLCDIPALRPYAGALEKLIQNKSEFMSRAFDLSALLFALPAFDSFAQKSLKDSLPPWPWYAIDVISSSFSLPENAPRNLTLTAIAVGHLFINLCKSDSKPLPQFDRVTLEDVYDLILIGLQAKSLEGLKPKQPEFKLITELNENLRPHYQELKRCIDEKFIPGVMKSRATIIKILDAAIDKEWQAIESVASGNFDHKSLLPSYAQLTPVLGAFIKEILFLQNSSSIHSPAVHRALMGAYNLKIKCLTHQINILRAYATDEEKKELEAKTPKGKQAAKTLKAKANALMQEVAKSLRETETERASYTHAAPPPGPGPTGAPSYAMV